MPCILELGFLLLHNSDHDLNQLDCQTSICLKDFSDAVSLLRRYLSFPLRTVEQLYQAYRSRRLRSLTGIRATFLEPSSRDSGKLDPKGSLIVVWTISRYALLSPAKRCQSARKQSSECTRSVPGRRCLIYLQILSVGICSLLRHVLLFE